MASTLCFQNTLLVEMGKFIDHMGKLDGSHQFLLEGVFQGQFQVLNTAA